MRMHHPAVRTMLVVLMFACTTQRYEVRDTRKPAMMSSGVIPCGPDEIHIFDSQIYQPPGKWTWVAVCAGRRYFCSSSIRGGEWSDAICSQ